MSQLKAARFGDNASLAERLTRHIARRTSRRGVIGRLGAMLVAAPVFPLLPVARAAERKPGRTNFELHAQTTDPLSCDYWRYCAIDGILCGCCGGGPHSCPPGTVPSPTAWVGTCVNPDDSRSYLIAYRDCCGRAGCATSETCGHCRGTDRELPVYRPQLNNDIIWCFGESSMTYNCSTAALVGLAE